MKKILFVLLSLSLSLFAGVTNQVLDKKLYNSSVPIVDIRTPKEWSEDGILKRAITIMSWDAKGNFNQKFFDELKAKVDVKKPFALICRSGSRTHLVAAYLSDKLGYNVINLEGGMIYTKDKKFPIIHIK